MTTSFDFSGQSVLVTGSSRGIGLGVATAFAAAGAETWLLADDEAVLSEAARLTGETGAKVSGLVCDITDPAALAQALAAIPRLDVLVNNAGLEKPTPLADPDPAVEETFSRIIDINVKGSFAVTRAALPKLGAGGRILLTSSIWGKTAVADFSGYVASKHAVIGLMRSWAKELGPRGIRVNAVCPGWVETGASLASLRSMAAVEGRSPAELLAEITGAQALEGLLTPAEVAPLFLFLASDAAANITGQAVNIDRGEVLG